MTRILIAIGLAFLLGSLLWPLLQRLGLGRLPGDFRIATKKGVLHLPLATSLIASIALSSIVWLIGRWI